MQTHLIKKFRLSSLWELFVGIKMNDKTTIRKIPDNVPSPLINDIAKLIDDARNHIAREHNSTHALLCWLIGKRVDEEILNAQRAEYGEAIVTSLAEQLL